MGRLTAIVLGAAAGGGFPQWNCRCPVCRLAWAGDARVQSRLQASLAVSVDREQWTLLNTTPDLGAQLRANAALHPRDGIRSTPIRAIVLTGAEVDETAGLLTLRESAPFALYASAETLAILAANSLFGVLQADLVRRVAVAPGDVVLLPGGIEAEIFSVPGKVPLYLEAQHPDLTASPAGNIGIELRSDGARLIYVPAAAAVPDELQRRLAEADVLLFDGTLFADDEMIRAGVGAKSGRRMGHLPIDGPDGSLARLAGLAKRRIFTHINNTNPILIEGSAERRLIEAAGFEVATDGLEIAL